MEKSETKKGLVQSADAVESVGDRLRKKLAITDAYFHFIDTGEISPLVYLCLDSPDESELLHAAAEMLDDRAGYPWTIKRQVAKIREREPHGRPKEGDRKIDLRLTYMKVAIEKHEQILRWRGVVKPSKQAIIEAIFNYERLPPVLNAKLSNSAKYALFARAQSHQPKDLKWLNDVEVRLFDEDFVFMELAAQFED